MPGVLSFLIEHFTSHNQTTEIQTIHESEAHKICRENTLSYLENAQLISGAFLVASVASACFGAFFGGIIGIFHVSMSMLFAMICYDLKAGIARLTEKLHDAANWHYPNIDVGTSEEYGLLYAITNLSRHAPQAFDDSMLLKYVYQPLREYFA